MSEPINPAAEVSDDLSWDQLNARLSGKSPEPVKAPEPVAAAPTVEEPPANEEEIIPAEPAPAESELSVEEKEAAVAAKKVKSLNQRFSELTAQREAEKRRADELARELADLKAGKPAQPPGPNVAPPAATEEKPVKPVRPDPDTFTGTYAELQAAQKKYDGDLEKWVADTTSWQVKQTLAQAKAEESKAAREAQAATVAKTWAERRDAAIVENPDIAEAVQELGLLVNAKMMDDLIMDSEVGPQILLHLKEHPEDLERFKATTNTNQAARLLGRIEAQLLNAKAPTPPPAQPAKPLPKPPATVGPRAAPPPVNLEDADQRTFNKEIERVSGGRW